jgi:hypothetical protein
MNQEIKSLWDNNTWELVKMPPDRKPLGCKWVFAGKRDQDGNIIKFKARLVAQGYGLILGVDYVESYNPMIKKKVIRLRGVRQNI